MEKKEKTDPRYELQNNYSDHAARILEEQEERAYTPFCILLRSTCTVQADASAKYSFAHNLSNLIAALQ